MYNKTIIWFSFRDIQNNQGLGMGYQHQPSASADNPYLNFDHSEYHKKPYPIIVFYIKHERPCSIGISKHREQSWKHNEQRSIFLTKFEVSEWILYLPSDCRVARYELISPSISQYYNKGQTTTPGTPCPTLYDKRVGSFTSPANITSKMQETGPTVYSRYLRRPERLTICRYNYKGSTFFSVILRAWVLVRSGARTLDLPHSRPVLYQLS